jgi:hypothetical protein
MKTSNPFDNLNEVDLSSLGCFALRKPFCNSGQKKKKKKKGEKIVPNNFRSTLIGCALTCQIVSLDGDILPSFFVVVNV